MPCGDGSLMFGSLPATHMPSGTTRLRSKADESICAAQNPQVTNSQVQIFPGTMFSKPAAFAAGIETRTALTDASVLLSAALPESASWNARNCVLSVKIDLLA